MMRGQAWVYPYPRWSLERSMLFFLAICATGAALSVGLMVYLSMGLVGKLVYPVISLVVVTVVWRRALAGLAFNRDAVRVRTTVWTRVLPWADIRRFVVDTAPTPAIRSPVRVRTFTQIRSSSFSTR